MVMSVSRAVIRQSAKFTSRVARRNNTTSAKASEAASKASESAQNFQSKASEGLSKATSAAGPAISGAVKGVSNALGKIGGRTGKLIAFVERQIPPTIYYARVGLELSKLVFKGQNMALPPMSTFQTFYQNLIRNPTSVFGKSPISAVRNASGAQIAAGVVVAGEVLGFFTVGEMLGRMKLVGYRGDVGGAHH